MKKSGKSRSPDYRYIGIDTEFRIDEDRNQLIGYAAKFNSWSQDLGGFRERIAPGAFRKTIKEADIRGLFNHDANYVLGRTSADTLRLIENNSGLKYEIDLPDTSFAKDLKESIKRGDITQNSFSFLTIQDEWSDDMSKRELLEVKLFDVGPVTFPAYEQTSVKVRSALQKVGIDYDKISIITTKANRNIVLLDDDIEALQSTIKTLNDFIPELVPTEDHTSKPDLSTLLRAKRIRLNVRKILSNI